MALTKQDLIDSLEKQGVQLSGKETVAELKKLVSDNAEHVQDAPENVPAPEDIAETEPSPTVNPDDVTEAVVMFRGEQVRVYSRQIHGDAFINNANEFVSHNEGYEVVLK